MNIRMARECELDGWTVLGTLIILFIRFRIFPGTLLRR